MTNPVPGPPLEIILPGGDPGYLNPYSGQYTRSQTYALRMQRNYSRGLPQSSARGHAAVGGYSESQIRAQREQAKHGDQLPPWQRFGIGFQQRYGFSYSYWRKLRRQYIAEINERALPHPTSNRMMTNGTQRTDPRVFPSDITRVMQLYQSGFRDPVYPDMQTWQQWAELRLLQNLH